MKYSIHWCRWNDERARGAEDGTMIGNEIRWWWITTNSLTKKSIESVCLYTGSHSHTYTTKPNKVNGSIIKIKELQLWPSFDDYQWAEAVETDWFSVNMCISMWECVVCVFQVLSCIEWSKTAATLYGIPIRPTDSFSLRFTCSPTCWAKMFLQRCYYVVFHRLVSFNVQIK